MIWDLPRTFYGGRYLNSIVVVVDTFTTIDQNQQLVDWITKSGKNLTIIYITHAHGRMHTLLSERSTINVEKFKDKYIQQAPS
jgi:hypothetical protein